VPELTCYACEREPTQQCARCGRPYCDEHGEDFCDVCLAPSSGVPSFNLYRGSLLALFIGAAVAIYLIIQPGSDDTASALRPVEVTRTPVNAGTLTTPAGTGSPAAGSPQPTLAPGTTSVAGATSTTRPATTTTPGAAQTGVYVVVAGDSLSLICSDKIRRPGTMTVQECVDQIKSLNSLTSDAISVGQQLRVPQ
jgi:LysM repeat protein